MLMSDSLFPKRFVVFPSMKPFSTGTESELLLQPGKKCVLANFLVFRSGKVPILNFLKVCTCPPWAIFLEATMTSAKTENAHISTEKSQMKMFNSSIKF